MSRAAVVGVAEGDLGLAAMSSKASDDDMSENSLLEKISEGILTLLLKQLLCGVFCINYGGSSQNKSSDQATIRLQKRGQATISATLQLFHLHAGTSTWKVPWTVWLRGPKISGGWIHLTHRSGKSLIWKGGPRSTHFEKVSSTYSAESGKHLFDCNMWTCDLVQSVRHPLFSG